MPLKNKQAANMNRTRGSQLTGGNVPNWTSSQNDTARQVMLEFMNAGASSAGAAGIVGNWYQESSLNPSEQGGYLAQWLGSRLANLQSFARNIGAPITSVEAQSRFAIQEMQQSYPQLWAFLKTTKDPQAAALMISNQYERPAAWAANNTNRQNQAAAAYQYLAGGVSSALASGGGPNNSSSPGGGGGGGSGAPSSVLDLLTSPISSLGGWLGQIAFDLIKDSAIAIGDDLIIPFWHWNQSSVAVYLQNLEGNDLLWTAAFWSFGYALLFTDPDSGNFKPAPVRRSRLARHVRSAQAIPARMSLIKPKDVARKTPKKPKPQISRAIVTQTGTMRAIRRTPVQVTGTHAREFEGNPDRSETRIERAGTFAATGEKTRSGSATQPRSKSDAEHRAGSGSLSDSSGVTRGNS